MNKRPPWISSHSDLKVQKFNKRPKLKFLPNSMTNSKPPSPPNQGWSRPKGKNAPFFHPWFGESGGSRFSIYFAQDFRVSCFHVSSVSRCLELVMKHSSSFLTHYMKPNGVRLVTPSISNSVFKQAFELNLKLQEINNCTFRSNLQLFFTFQQPFWNSLTWLQTPKG